ncbi:MAG: GatB/YqeY domain-containing protein [Candidatus Marinimicrobia bacterium]|nr:GatB/YqeY domain-containing protein [Candidatus Neomarinimicrobiota bacterium]
MNLFDTIQKDMYAAMKSGEKEKVVTLRTALSKLKDKKIEKREELSEQDELQVLKTMVKQRNESIEIYEKAGREDLVAIEKSEVDILETFLPQMMSAENLGKMIDEIITETGASSMSDIGRVMPEIMKRSAGRADGKMAQSLVSEKLS